MGGHHHAVVDCHVPLEGDEDKLLSASWDKTARLWDINRGKHLVHYYKQILNLL